MIHFRQSASTSCAGILALAAALAVPVSLPAQNPRQMTAKPAPANKAPAPALDPAAMQALKTMSDQLRAAQSLSFTVRIMASTSTVISLSSGSSIFSISTL